MQVVLQPLTDWIRETFGSGPNVAVAVLAASFAAGALLHRVVLRGLASLFSRTRTDLDERLLRALRWPVMVTVVLVGAFVATELLDASEATTTFVERALLTTGLVVWTVLGLRLSTILLQFASSLADRYPAIDRRTVPLFSNLATIVVLGLAVYLGLLIWSADPTGWLASAGILGVALGFAAKDTLSNLFAGVFIIADGPYQLGDYVVLDDDIRGEVVHIGLRSTRVQTRDDVHITVPNAVIGTSMIINQSGGGSATMRVRIPVGVSYDSDVDQVKRVLLELGREGPDVVDEPAPRVRFRSLGDSALEFELLVWVSDPAWRGRTVDAILTALVKRFREEGIDIPYPHRTVYVHGASPADAPRVPDA